VGLVPTVFFAARNLLFLASAVSGALLSILSTNYNILAFEQQIIARYGRQTLSKADIVAQHRIPLATRF
jgi:hypothetical protein